MISEHVFLKKNNDGKIIKVESAKEAEYVRIPASDYIGYENAIRIIRDRGKQQIDKAKADDHGYTLLRADYKTYDYSRKEEKAWLVTKSTPHSINIPLRTVNTLLKRDLEEYYNFIGYPELEDDDSSTYRSSTRMLTASDIIKAHQQSNDDEHMEKYSEWFCTNTPFGRNIKQFFDKVGSTDVAFEISKISCNYAQGVYEVSYWATAPI